MATAEQPLTRQLTAELLAPRPAGSSTDTARRIQRLVAGFRMLAAFGLLLVASLPRQPPLLEPRYPGPFATAALSYTAVAALLLLLHWRGERRAAYLPAASLCADIVFVSLLSYTGGGISSGLGGLLVVFIGAAALSLPREQALLSAAVGSLAVLGEQMLAFTLGLASVNAFIPAGVLGAIIFLVTAAANPLARRLRESEALALQRGIDLANLAQLNDYVIQNLRESIVVVDENDHIRLINQSAADLLGHHELETGKALASVAPQLASVLRNWRRGYFGHDYTLGFPSAGGTTRINTYFAPLEDREDGPVLMFLEDSTLLAEKVRQTKLAALGRLSASIAHEIRNPVGALSHAGQLLQESAALRAREQRLLDIIAVNSRRVSEIVESVMQLSRREATKPESIELAGWLDDFLTEFRSTLELEQGQFRVLPEAAELEVRMDPGQLRQVCWNLCENAVQYGAGPAGQVQIDIRYGRLAGSRRPYLEIADRGPGIAEAMRDQLFEPFATGRAGGTGLGLFISRELCECNRAALVFEPRDGGGSIFRIVFADPRRWGSSR